MPPSDVEPRYIGSFVTIRAVGLSYAVAIEPPLPTGEGEPRAFSSKHEAWGAARELWCRHQLPLQDETEGHFGRRNVLKQSDE